MVPSAWQATVGSVEACHRPSASAETRVYVAGLRTDACPDNAISTGVEAPASAAWVSLLWRS
ncbi:hypothetical protein [Nocardia nova]|uniref:hypothetical protein n=1 Tax=Nocardia nova TaxID=37330 RepID=UPI0015E467CF|nr:hypothetical protein [Nocardia nova]